MAGHSHWSKIKRAKGANDAKRGKIWSKIARKIIIAAKNGGDPRDNLNLRYTIEEGKAVNMPKDTIEKAIKKGTGELVAENYEAVTYEAYAPGGIAIIIEGLTNNPARTAPELRSILEKNGGNLASRGAVAFQFTKQGIITIKSEGVDEDHLMEVALEAGAEDVRNEGEVFEVITTPTGFLKVKEAIEAAKVPVEAGEITQMPNNTVAVGEEQGQKLLKLIDLLDDNDDVQSVAHNAEIPESVGVWNPMNGRIPLLLVTILAAITPVTLIAAPPAPPRIESIVLASSQPFEIDPAVIWYDSFDGPDSVQAKYLEPKPGSADDRRTDKEALGGAGKSMECFYAKGKQGVGNRKIVFGDSPIGRPLRKGETFDEIYWRIYVKHPAGWTGSPAKMSRATGFVSGKWDQAFILHVWSSKDALTLDPATGVRGDQVVTTRYNDFDRLKWLGNKPNGKFPIHATEEAGCWVCVEAHLKLNTPGKKDGAAQLWIDGVLDTERTGMDFRGTYTGRAINAVMLEAYWNEGSPVDQSRWYDDFVVSKKPIGPLTAAASPTFIKTAGEGIKAWEVEIAADAEGRQVVWKSRPAPVTQPAARLTAGAETGVFAGESAASKRFESTAVYFARCRQQDSAGQWSDWSRWHQPFRVGAPAAK